MSAVTSWEKLMKHPTDRRTVLMAAGAAAVAAATGAAAAQSANIAGTVLFESGKAIPVGQLEIYLEDPGAQNKGPAAQTRVESDGASKSIAFSLSPPAISAASPTLRLVARLERADGFLLARGSARLDAGAPVSVTLNTVMY